MIRTDWRRQCSLISILQGPRRQALSPLFTAPCKRFMRILPTAALFTSLLVTSKRQTGREMENHYCSTVPDGLSVCP